MTSLTQEQSEIAYRCGAVIFAQIEAMISQNQRPEKVVLELYIDEAMFLCSVLSLVNRCQLKPYSRHYSRRLFNHKERFTEREKKQYVYLVHAIGTNRYKIGRTTDLRTRITQLSTGTPYKVSLLASYETKNSLEEELILHKKLSCYRVNGEWFEFSSSQLGDFRGNRELLTLNRVSHG